MFGREQLHPCHVIIVPNVVQAIQPARFAAVLEYISDRDLVSRTIEINLIGDERSFRTESPI